MFTNTLSKVVSNTKAGNIQPSDNNKYEILVDENQDFYDDEDKI